MASQTTGSRAGEGEDGDGDGGRSGSPSPRTETADGNGGSQDACPTERRTATGMIGGGTDGQ